MVLSSSQQLVMAFTAVLLVFVLFPRMFSGGSSSRDGQSFEPRISKRGSDTSTAASACCVCLLWLFTDICFPMYIISPIILCLAFSRIYCVLLTVFAVLMLILLTSLGSVKFVLTPLIYSKKCFLSLYLYLSFHTADV